MGKPPWAGSGPRASPPPAQAGGRDAGACPRAYRGVGQPSLLLSLPLPPCPSSLLRPCPLRSSAGATAPAPPDGGGAEAGARSSSASRASSAPRAAPTSPAAGRLASCEGAGETPPRALALTGCRPDSAGAARDADWWQPRRGRAALRGVGSCAEKSWVRRWLSLAFDRAWGRKPVTQFDLLSASK